MTTDIADALRGLGLCASRDALDALLAKTCNGRTAGATIVFFPGGMSCGGTIDLRRGDVGFQIRVNWLTGGNEVVSLDTAAK